MIKLINQGQNELTAIDLIKQCYGQSATVTQVINALTRAKSAGYHPNMGLSYYFCSSKGK